MLRASRSPPRASHRGHKCSDLVKGRSPCQPALGLSCAVLRCGISGDAWEERGLWEAPGSHQASLLRPTQLSWLCRDPGAAGAAG